AGTKHIPEQTLKVLERVGAGGGAMANGTTSFDRTNYFEVVPSTELPTALWVESERMGFLLEALTPTSLQVQRDVVSNERRQTYENRAYGTAHLRLCERLFPPPHPYSGCVIGNIAEIQAASLDDVKGFFRQFYGPNNASLAVVGDFDSATARGLIEKYFAAIPRGPDVPRPDIAQPALASEIRERLEDNVATVPMLRIAWPGVRPYSAEEPAADTLARILGQGPASRLRRRLVVDKQIAASVYAGDDSAELGGSFVVEVIHNAGHNTEEMLAATQEVLDDLREHGPTDAEVLRARRNAEADLLRGLQGLGGFGGRADRLNEYFFFAKDPGYLPKDLARYRAVAAADVKAFAQKHLTDHRLILDIEPHAAAAPGAHP
ncbi:MAG TPA: pitrilysin family protein, partial [Myxococcaceae bacterium]|nr:pitrilysin family protein [Myxococcaceae bacterium]